MPLFKVLSQSEAELYRPSENDALISIATPKWNDIDYPVPKLKNWAAHPTLSLCFHDSDPKMLNNVGLSHMTMNDAYLILNFMEEHLGRNIIVHCWKGVSRSPTIARSLYNLYAKDNYVCEKQPPSAWKTNYHVERLLYDAARERDMDRALISGFIAYQKLCKLHPQEEMTHSQIYEAGWSDCLKYMKNKPV